MKHIIAILMLALVASCGGKKDSSPSDSRSAQGGKFYGGVFRVNEVGELRSLDPVGINDATSTHIAEQIYDGLLSLDTSLRLQAELAERWEVSPDGLTYTYFLRKGVMFHDNPCFPNGKGRELKAEDVRYSFNRICDARTGSLGYDYFKGKVVGSEEYYKATQAIIGTTNKPSVEGVKGFKAVDDYTFQIILTKIFAPFEYYVALSQAYIEPHEAVEFYKENFFKNPVGTGPFSFVNWKPDQECILKRNPIYWKKDEFGNQLPLLDEIRFSFMKDEKTQLLEFRQGNLEESYRIPAEFFGDIVDENKNPKGDYANFKLFHIPALSTQFYGMLTTSKEFTDKRVRQAFAQAIDRDRILKYVLKGQGAGPAVMGLVPPSLPDYQSSDFKGYSFNVEKARALMAEAGFPNGKGFSTVTLQINAGGGRNVQIAESIQSMLMENLGIKVELKQVEWARHLDEVDAGRAAFYRLGWVADYPDPENFLNLYYGKLVPEKADAISPINHSRYKNPEFDKLFEQALATLDRAKRTELYRQAEQIAVNDAPLLLICYDEDYRFVQNYVEDYRNNSMDRRPFKYVWFNPAKRKK